jgi:hypothetical protein
MAIFAPVIILGTTILCVMLPSRKWRLLVFLLALTFRVPSLSALIIETRQYRGTQVQCVHGGAWLSETDLGVYSGARLYEQVFTGTVQSVVEITFTDRRLQIIPDEVFLGDVAGEITATVNQACLPENLPEIKAGDKWIFYLRTKKYLHPDAKTPYISTDGLIVVFDSPSKPVSQAQNDICLLRHHSDESERCAEAPRPRHMYVCEGQSFLLTSPLPRSIPFQEIPPTALQFSLKHIAAPPEFRSPDPNLPTRVILQTRRWPSCSPDADESE